VSVVVLIGMPGCGKSSIAKILATRRKSRLVTIDADIEAAWGMSVSELFAERGEAVFRTLESNAIAHAIGSEVDAVVAVGGGAVTTREAREAISRADAVVWLRASLETLRRRVGDARARPLLAGDPAEALSRLLSERTGLYESVATLTVDVDGLSQRNVADLVEAGLQ